MEQQNAVKIKLEGDTSGIKAALAEVMSVLDNLKQAAGNIAVGGSGSVAVGGNLASTPGTFQVSSSVKPTRVAAPRGGGGISTPSGPAASSSSHALSMGATQSYTPAQLRMAQNPSDPFGMVGTPVWQRMQNAINNPQMAKGMAYAFGEAAQGFLNNASQETLTGHISMSGRAAVGWGLAGGIAGAGIGAMLGGPFGGYIGASMGTGVGQALGTYFTAPAERDYQSAMALSGSGGLQASLLHSMGNFPSPYGWQGTPGQGYTFGQPNARMPASVYYATKQVDFVNDLYGRIGGRMGVNSPFLPKYDELAQGFSSVFTGMAMGGLDPMRLVSNGPRNPNWQSQIQGGINTLQNGLAGNTPGHYSFAAGMSQGIIGIINSMKTREELAQYVTGNIGMRYPTATAQIGKEVGEVFAGLPDTGGNPADILMKSGPLSAYRFYESLTPLGKRPGIDQDAFLGVYNSVRRDNRAARLAGLQSTGVGRGLERAYINEEADIAQLPGGTESEAFASARARRRSATLRKYSEEDILSYDIPMTRLQGERERANYLPFSPGNIFGMELRSIGMNEKQLATVSARYNSLKGRGDLSEEQQLQFESTMQSLQTSIARSYGTLSEGFENKLPAMSAGRPSFGARFNSMQGAAFNLQFMGSPIRAFGAANGHQLHGQDDFVNAYAVRGNVGPTSRTQDMNNQPVISLLQRIADRMDQMASSNRSGRLSENVNFGAALGATVGNLNTNQPGSN